MDVTSRLSVRARLTLFFELAIFVIASVVSVALVAIVHQAAINHDRADIAQYMAQVQNEFAVQRSPVMHRMVLPSDTDVVIQVTNVSQNEVWASSPQIENSPVLSTVYENSASSNGLGARLRVTPSLSGVDSELSLATVETITTKRGPGLVFGFIYGGTVSRSVQLLLISLFVSLPFLLLASGLLIWFGIGLALAPVESIRSRVDEIAGEDLAQRVPVPGGDDEITRMAKTVNEMLDRLEASSKFQQEFVSNASHELRSPLTTLLTTTERAKQNPEEANWSEVAEVVTREGRRLNQLIDDLFWLTRHDEGHIEQKMTDVDLDDLLFEEAQRVRSLSDFSVDVSNVTPIRVQGDPALLKRLLRNVVDNALRYVETQLVFSCSVDGDEAVLRVANDGEGVDVATSDVLFQRFVRADSARDRASGGTGLGLSIVQGIAERHGGRASFQPVEVGTLMEIRLRRDGQASRP